MVGLTVVGWVIDGGGRLAIVVDLEVLFGYCGVLKLWCFFFWFETFVVAFEVVVFFWV